MISKDMIGNISGVFGLIFLIIGSLQLNEEIKTNAMTQTGPLTLGCIALPLLLLFLALSSSSKPPVEED